MTSDCLDKGWEHREIEFEIIVSEQKHRSLLTSDAGSDRHSTAYMSIQKDGPSLWMGLLNLSQELWSGALAAISRWNYGRDAVFVHRVVRWSRRSHLLLFPGGSTIEYSILASHWIIERSIS